MKRFCIFVALTFTLILAGFAVVKINARADGAPTQFQGNLTYHQTGEPVHAGALVQVYLDGVLKDQVTTIASGFYAITAYDQNYPTGTYLVRAEDGTFYGAHNYYHVQGTTTSNCNVALRWALP